MNKPTTLLEAVKAYADIDFALGESADSRWPKGVACAHCGADAPMFLKTRKIWKCSKCRKQFSFKAGTVFEDSPIGLDKWLPAVWIIANARNGVSSHELGRSLGVTQKTAWFMLHRIRLAMQDDLTGGMLNGEVEVDESYIGGKVRNMHKDRKLRVQRDAKSQKGDKAIVLGILERASAGKKSKRVRATVVPDRKKPTMQSEVAGVVERGAKVYSDEFAASWRMDDRFEHSVVDHLSQYVDGQVHTNGLENFWSLLKRGLGGTYISVEPFHLFRYVDEQAFRYNNRLHPDGEVVSDYARFKRTLNQVVGRRLTYSQLIGKEASSEAEAAF
jgi:transposase-like protein